MYCCYNLEFLFSFLFAVIQLWYIEMVSIEHLGLFFFIQFSIIHLTGQHWGADPTKKLQNTIPERVLLGVNATQGQHEVQCKNLNGVNTFIIGILVNGMVML